MKFQVFFKKFQDFQKHMFSGQRNWTSGKGS